MSKEFIPVCEPALEGNEEKYVLQTLRTGWISSSGEFVKKFENDFAEYCGVSQGISTSNGTAALHLALLAAGVKEGDEVILPDFTMIATLFAVLYCKATPVFVDVEEDTWNMDPALVEEKITGKTKAVIPVHIFGHPVDMDPINALAKKHNLVVIEDSAEAHGALYKGKKCGSLGDIACFSFFANKLITTGEGGMVVTNSPELADKARYHRNLCFKLGGPRDFIHYDLGYNYRFTNVQAAIGLGQLEKIDYYIECRRKIASLYSGFLKDIPGFRLPIERSGIFSVYWMYALLIDEKECGISRDDLAVGLKEQGIDSRLLFAPMHSQPLLEQYGIKDTGKYPVTERLSKTGLYLPSSSSLTEEKIARICETVAGIVKKG